MKTIYLSLGSNIGNREQNLADALAELDACGIHITRVSSIYETEPVGYTAQRWFLNLAAEAQTELFPMQLLTRIAKIERILGRTREIPNGPRTIDIDILFYEKAVVRSPKLEIPHPRMADRRFVLAPLADLAPDLRHPVTRKTVREMLDSAAKSGDRQQVNRLTVAFPSTRRPSRARSQRSSSTSLSPPQ